MDKYISKLFVEEECMRCLLCYDAPCSKACPAKTNPAKFIRSIRFKNYDGAINTIRHNNIFGATCSEICKGEEYCQKACIRNKIDKPINIKYLQRFLMEKEEVKEDIKEKKNNKGKVVIVGGDIKGYTAANEFLDNCYSVIMYVNKSIEEYLSEYISSGELSENMLRKDIKNICNKGLIVNKYIPAISELEKIDFKAIIFAAEDIQYIHLENEYLKEKSFYINKKISRAGDIVFSVKAGKETAKKVIEEIEKKGEVVL